MSEHPPVPEARYQATNAVSCEVRGDYLVTTMCGAANVRRISPQANVEARDVGYVVPGIVTGRVATIALAGEVL